MTVFWMRKGYDRDSFEYRDRERGRIRAGEYVINITK
jgi:hypothetical protein